jgi:hypothetical protein
VTERVAVKSIICAASHTQSHSYTLSIHRLFEPIVVRCVVSHINFMQDVYLAGLLAIGRVQLILQPF